MNMHHWNKRVGLVGWMLGWAMWGCGSDETVSPVGDAVSGGSGSDVVVVDTTYMGADLYGGTDSSLDVFAAKDTSPGVVPDVPADVLDTLDRHDGVLTERDVPDMPDVPDIVDAGDSHPDIQRWLTDTSDGENSTSDVIDIAEEEQDIEDLPPIKGPLCQDECDPKTYQQTCTGDKTYLHCGHVFEGCKKVLPGTCPSAAICIDGECWCPPTGNLICDSLWQNVYEETMCSNKQGELVDLCADPGCYDGECVPQPSFTAITPWPTGGDFKAVSVVDDHWVAVGEDGTIVHGGPDGVVNRSIGRTYHFRAVLAQAKNTVYATSSKSGLHFFDGNEWKLLFAFQPPPQVVNALPANVLSPSGYSQQCLWGDQPTRFFSAGGMGTIYYFNGETATSMTNPHLGKPLVGYKSIWGSSYTDVYAVGHEGNAVRFDGKSWKVIPQLDASVGGIGGQFRSISGTGKNNVLLVRGVGDLLHYDGTDWKPFEPKPPVGDGYIMRVVALQTGEIYLSVGEDKPYLYPTGNIEVPTLDDVRILYFDGQQWVGDIKTEMPGYFRAIAGNEKLVVTVGDQGMVAEVKKLDQTVVTQHRANGWAVDHLVDVWGFAGDEGDWVFAVGDWGTIVRKAPDGTITQWEMPELLPDYVASPLYGYYAAGNARTRPWNTVWGSSPTDVYVGGVGIVMRFDGTNWNQITLPGLYPDTLVMAIYGTGPDDVYVSGQLHYYGDTLVGYLARFDGLQWHNIPNVPSIGCMWAKDADTWYGVGWAPGGLFGLGPQGVSHYYGWGQATILARCHVAGVVATGELLYSFGSHKSNIGPYNAGFLTAEGEHIGVTFWLHDRGMYDIAPTPDNQLAIIWESYRVMTVDVPMLSEGIKALPPGISGPFGIELVLKPYVELPEYHEAMWWSPSGKLYTTSNNNRLTVIE